MEVRPRIALCHHWLHSMRGGERVLEQFCLLFPHAPIYTLFHRRKHLDGCIASRELHQSLIGALPGIQNYYRNLLPLFPLALKSLRIPVDYDLVLSCDASIVKGLAFSEPTKHCCYCCSPPRYLFDLQDQYLAAMSDPLGLKTVLVKALSPFLRRYDVDSASRVDSFITLSEFIRERIQRTYRRDSFVIEPPVDVDSFCVSETSEDFYLIVAALVPYKRVDLAIMACNTLKRKLVVIGDGPEMGRLRNLAGPTVSLFGSQGFKTLQKAYHECRAFLFPGIEDFGITALEAQAAGKPVIAIRKGAVLETVVEGFTGVFFEEQSADALADAILRFERIRSNFSPSDARRNAERYRPAEFRRKMKEFLEAKYPSLFNNYSWPH